jgi:hypothetical protein
MAKSIPLTNFIKYLTEAEAIRCDLRKRTGSPEAVRQAVLDLTGLLAKSLEKARRVIQGLALVVRSLQSDATRAPRRDKRPPRAQAARRP